MCIILYTGEKHMDYQVTQTCSAFRDGAAVTDHKADLHKSRGFSLISIK